jgi:hypothetical protein
MQIKIKLKIEERLNKYQVRYEILTAVPCSSAPLFQRNLLPPHSRCALKMEAEGSSAKLVPTYHPREQ